MTSGNWSNFSLRACSRLRRQILMDFLTGIPTLEYHQSIENLMNCSETLTSMQTLDKHKTAHDSTKCTRGLRPSRPGPRCTSKVRKAIWLWRAACMRHTLARPSGWMNCGLICVQLGWLLSRLRECLPDRWRNWRAGKQKQAYIEW